MSVFNLVSAGPAASGPRELVDAAPVWPAASSRAPAEAGSPARWVPGTVEGVLTHTERGGRHHGR